MHAAAAAGAKGFWESEVLGAVPARLVEDQDRVGAGGYPCADLIEMKLHGFGVAERQNEGRAGSMFGAYRAEQIGRLGALIMRGWAASPSWPSDK